MRKLSECEAAICLAQHYDKQLFSSGVVSSENLSLPQLETTLLQLASSPGLVKGVFYCLGQPSSEADQSQYQFW